MKKQNYKFPNSIYGYDRTSENPSKIILNEFEADVIRQIFDLYINSGQGALKIATLLNQKNILTKRKCTWSQNSVARILHNEIYTGITFDKNSNLKIIDKEVFELANNISTSRCTSLKLAHRRQSNKNSFSSILRCKCCGYSFRRLKREYKNVIISWVCSGRNSKGKDFCPNSTKILESDLINHLKEHFLNILNNKKAFAKEVFGDLYIPKKENTAQLKELLEKTSKAEKKLKKSGASEKINKKIKKYQEKINLLNANLENRQRQDLQIEKLFGDISDVISQEHFDNEALKKVASQIIVGENGDINIKFVIT